MDHHQQSDPHSRDRRSHQSHNASGTHRHLQSTVDQLKQTYNNLLEERSQLLQQQHLLTSLADVLGQYRSSLVEDDMFAQLPRRGGLEELLLDQLTLRLPSSLTFNRAATSNSAGSSCNSNSEQGEVEGDEVADGDEVVSSSPGAVANNATSRHNLCSFNPQAGHPAPVPQQVAHSSGGMMSVEGQQCNGPADQLQEGSAQHEHAQYEGQAQAEWMQDSYCPHRSLESLQEASTAAEQRQEGMQQLAQLQQLMQPICPEHDPFLLMRSIYSQPIEESAYTITFEELQQLWASDVQQLRCHLLQLQVALQRGSMQLHAPEVPAPASTWTTSAGAGAAGPHPGAEHAAHADHPTGGANGMQGCEQQQERQHVPAHAYADPLLSIRHVMMRMFVMCSSLEATGRMHLFFGLQLTNWVTGERIQEPCKERHRAALQELQLTQSQLQRISTGFKFFQQLLAPILAERKVLQAKGIVLPAAPAREASMRSHAAGQRATVGAVLLAGPAAHSGHGMQLQAQCEQVARLKLLARKDVMVRGAMVCYLQGCLSWVQQAKLRILMSPYHVNAGLLCSEVLVQMQAQQQQQQQALSCSPAALLHIGTGENGAGASVGAGSSTPMSLG